MKIFTVQIKVGFLMILAVILLSGAGYLSYRNLSSIVSSIRVDEKPELRLLRIREISMDLEKAQNSIRIFTLTGDTADLLPYYKIISAIDNKMSRLREEFEYYPVMLAQTDTIRKLIKQNIVTWNRLLSLNNNRNVNDYLNQLSERLKTESENPGKTEKNIFKRVFSRNKNQSVEKELISDLQEIKQQDSITKEKLIKRESQLARTGSMIKEQIYDLINKIETEISGNIESKANAADQLARKTYFWLALFSLTGTLLAITVMFIIVRFVRKTQLYQLALQDSKTETEKLSRTKELFMANISHEIRTPITAISGFTEQLLHEPLQENINRILKIIKSSSDHLTNLINELLDFSKLQNGNIVLEKVHFSIRQILEDVFALFERQAIRNNTILSYSLNPGTPAVLSGDPYRLKQIIINLVSNSVKFTKNGKVHYIVKGIEKQSDEIELVIEVIDTGIGIDESKLKYIFEDFTQEEMSTTRNYGGTGLGLSIVKKLVELHNGTIECFSKKNHGTQIICHLPYLKGDEKQIKSEFEPPLYVPDEIRALKILIVDDEEYNRLLFKMILERWKVKYYEASNGNEALELLKTDRYDLLFMDSRMPGIDGLKATQIIRNEMHISQSEMPVICISAVNVNEDWQTYSKAGMNAFLPKPFTEEMLMNTILSVMKDYSPFTSPDKLTERNIKPVNLDKINLNNIYHLAGNDEKFVKQMLVSFIDSTKKGLDEIHNAVFSGNLETVADLAHKMLPPCRHTGAIDLYNYLRKIEESVRGKSGIEVVKTLTTESIREFEAVSELIQTRISKIN